MDVRLDASSKSNLALPRWAMVTVAVAASALAIGGAVVGIRYLDSVESRADARLADSIARIGVFADQSLATATPEESGETADDVDSRRAIRNEMLGYALEETPGIIAESPRSPAEMQPFSLKPGESATLTFGCGEGDWASTWTETVDVVSIIREEGDTLSYEAKLSIGGTEHEVSDTTYWLDTPSGNTRVYFIRVSDDKVSMFLVRNAC